MAAPTLLLGSSLTAKGAWTSSAASPWACAGLAVGVDSVNPKQWQCEDSVVVVPLEDGGLLAAVADAHWGGRSGEVIAEGLAGAWRETRASDTPAARLRAALFLLDGRLLERGRDDRSETTALLAHVKDRALSYANVGDSLLLVIGRAAAAIKNFPTPVFMGGRPLATLPIPVGVGTVALNQGDVVLLASDGLDESVSGLEPEQVALALRSGEPLQARVDGLLKHVSASGRDNLGVVAIAV